MKLHEIADVKPYISEEAADWLWKKRDNHEIGSHFIQRDGTIDVDGSVVIHKADGTKLPVRFGKVSRGFNCAGSALLTLEGCPRFVGENFTCSTTQITSLEGAPLIVKGDFIAYDTQVRSLSGIGKRYAQYIGEDLTLTGHAAPTHIVGIVLIDRLKQVFTSDIKLDKLINKYIGTKDILNAVEALIQAGYSEQARL